MPSASAAAIATPRAVVFWCCDFTVTNNWINILGIQKKNAYDIRSTYKLEYR